MSTNRERQPYPVVPNGLACVASALRDAGHAVQFLDLCFSREPVSDAKDAALSFNPDFIGISVRNIDNSDAIALRHYTPDALEIVNAIRAAAPRAVLIAGVRRLVSLRKRYSRLLEWITPSPETESAQALPSSMQ